RGRGEVVECRSAEGPPRGAAHDRLSQPGEGLRRERETPRPPTGVIRRRRGVFGCFLVPPPELEIPRVSEGWDFAGKYALITGGTSGIGRAVAHAFDVAGASVLATGRDAAEVAAFVAEEDRRAESEHIAARPLDVTDPDAIAALVRTLERLDILVNCAGVLLRQGAEFEP